MSKQQSNPGLIGRALDFWHRLEDMALVVVLVSIVVLVFLEVLVRNLELPIQMRWMEEVTLILLIWLTLLGAGVCQRDNSHLKVDLFAGLLPPPLRKAVLVLVNLGIAVFLVLVIKGSIPIMGQAMIAKTSVLEWPAVIWPLAVFVGMGLAAIYFFTGHFASLVRWFEGRGKWKR